MIRRYVSHTVLEEESSAPLAVLLAMLALIAYWLTTSTATMFFSVETPAFAIEPDETPAMLASDWRMTLERDEVWK